MKKVFRNSEEVIHLFAQRTQKEARCSNVFFDGDSIYSYGRHYELARFLDDETIWINDSGYSSTTSKHISEVKYATRQYKQFFEMETDLEKVYNQCLEAKQKLKVARKPELYTSEISRLWGTLNEYCEYDRKNKKILKKDYIPYQDKRYKELKDLYKAITTDLNSLKELARKEKERAAKALKMAIKEFYEYDRHSIRIGNNEDYVRLSKCGEYVETSQGVRVSRKAAKILFQMIEQGRDVKGFHIDHYIVNSVNGTLKIGCHNINMESVYRTGNLL